MKKYNLINGLGIAVSSVSLVLCLALVPMKAYAIPVLSLDFGNGPVESGWVGYGTGQTSASIAPSSATFGGLTVSVQSAGQTRVYDRGSYGSSGTNKDLFRDFIYSFDSADLEVSIAGLLANQAFFLELWSTDTAHSLQTVTDFSIGSVTNTVSNNAGLPTGLDDLGYMTTFNTWSDGNGVLAFTASKGIADDLGQAVRINALRLTAVPEPASLALFGLGLAGLGYVQRRRSLKGLV